MDVVIRIKNWATRFENNRSRECSQCQWFPMPNVFTYEWQWFIEQERASECVHAWLSMLMLASQVKSYARRQHGFLMLTAARPFDAASLSVVARIPKEVYEMAIERLQEADWIELVPLDKAIDLLEGRAPIATALPRPSVPPLEGATDDCPPTEVAAARGPVSPTLPSPHEPLDGDLGTPSGPLDAAVRDLVGKPLAMIASLARIKIEETVELTSEAIVIEELRKAKSAGKSTLRTIGAVCTAAKLRVSGAAFDDAKDKQKKRNDKTEALEAF